MRQAVIVEAVRTPVGRAHAEKGMYRDVRGDEMSADLMRALLDRVRLPPELVEDVHWGCVKQQQELGFDVARMAVLIAGLPVTIAGATVNRNCGSGLQAINQAAQSIAAGCEDVQIAGGVEHMHHLPMELGFDFSPRLFTRNSPATMHMGLTAENLARKFGISRRDQDAFALRSHRLAIEATDRGCFRSEIVPTWSRDDEGRRVRSTMDQCIRRDTSAEALAALQPVFLADGGTVTAGNASPNSVGAAALLVMSEQKARELGMQPKVRIRAMAVAGVDPAVMGLGPVPAIHKALDRAGLHLDDVGLFEINEAFAAQTLAVVRQLGIPEDKVNPRGGAIALGHPLGASGARIATTLIHAMVSGGVSIGVAALCIGAGQGIATVFELAA